MVCMSYNADSSRKEFEYSSQLTNCILDSGATCHMTPDISDCILRSLVETYKYIEVVYGHFFTVKERISSNKMCENNGKLFISIF